MLNSSGFYMQKKKRVKIRCVDISKEGLRVKTITEYTDTDPKFNVWLWYGN